MKKKHLLLAPNDEVDLRELGYPVLASYKLDGVRALAYDQEMVTRKWKTYGTAVHRRFWKILQEARREQVVLDGEICSSDVPFNEISSLVLSHVNAEVVPKHVRFYLFDFMYEKEWEHGCARGFQERIEEGKRWLQSKKHLIEDDAEFLDQFLVNTYSELETLFETAVNLGHEGLIIRNPKGLYKHGRATIREDIMYKMKKEKTVDAVLVGFTQKTQMREDYKESDERERDELGYLKRSHKKDNREKIDEIGAYEVKLLDGTRCKVNLGKDVDLGITWDNKDEFVGRHVEITYMPHGIKDKPRFGRIVRFRPDLDE